jgi:hypothetical protein
MDFRLKCLVCGAQVWLARPALEKRVREIRRPGAAEQPGPDGR